ncbi:MAG TPA: MFS transporter [Solirubrobacteraceae bacterium]|nr:MFS transporter [Solirubrobacteraceae bacterium]
MTSSRRTRAALAAMAAATFVFVTTETQPVALLDPLSSGLHVGPPAIGLLMTAYAVVAGLTAIPLTFASAGIRRRPLILACVAVLTVSQAAAAVAPSYGVMLAARLLCALAHGVFWSVIAQVAASLVAPERAGRATAAAFAGNSLALVAGTPLVTAIATWLGWRPAVALLGGAGALTLVALYLLLPDAPVAQRPSPASFARALRSRALLAVCAITTMVVIGHFAAFTFFAPIVRADAGLTGTGLALVLLVYGAAGVAGVVIAGALADRSGRLAGAAGCALVLIALVMLSLAQHSVAVTVIAAALWGLALTGLPVAWQTVVLRAVPHQPDGASSLYVVCFQVGIGGGALLGAGLLAADGVPAVLHAAVLFAALGTALAIVLGSSPGRLHEHRTAARA